MPRFNVDDKWHSHPKVVGLSLSAVGLWSKSGSWCNDHLTDGAVPRRLPASWRASDSDIQELVDAGLWTATEAGWQFHDWLDHNPSRAEILEKRRLEAERKARARKPSRGKRSSARIPAGLRHESSSPSPSPSPKERERAQLEPANTQSTAEDCDRSTGSDSDLAWVRIGKLYKQLFDAEQEGVRKPRYYNEQRITSTDARHFMKLVELVRAESERSHIGERAIFVAAAQSFLRNDAQRKKGLVLAWFVNDFHLYVDRSVEAAS
jgi:hypothetical protein